MRHRGYRTKCVLPGPWGSVSATPPKYLHRRVGAGVANYVLADRDKSGCHPADALRCLEEKAFH